MNIRRVVAILLLSGITVFILLIFAMPAQAGTNLQSEQATATPSGIIPSPHDDPSDCLGCHANPKLAGQFPDGTIMSLYFDIDAHPKSNHMPRCAACHDKQQTYPHEGTRESSCSICHWQMTNQVEEPEQLLFPLPYPDKRTIQLDVSDSCKKCHKEKFTESADSVHLKMLAEGNRYAPVCVDCHKGHDIVPNTLTRASVPQICSECHLSVYTSYQSSIHGAALKEEGNPDVPTCGDCHGIHNVHGPSDAGFESDSIQTCGNCHSDPERMERYGLSTQVLQTFLDDFHGQSVDVSGESGSESRPAATCYDCHGIHNIRSVDDSLSTIYPENLQQTCQQCHEDAGIRFPQAWLNHTVPSLNDSPLLYLVNLFYQLWIPLVAGGILAYIVPDAWRRFSVYRRRNSNGTK